jgi:hypothetical protein
VTSSPAKPHGDLEELARAATGGRWRLWANEVRAGPEDSAERNDSELVCAVPLRPNGAGGSHVRDAYFIAAANPARILSLVGEVRSLKGALGRLTSEVGALWHKEYAGAAFGHPIGPTNYDVVRYCLEDARRALLGRDA